MDIRSGRRDALEGNWGQAHSSWRNFNGSDEF